jgi:hypothetical protein
MVRISQWVLRICGLITLILGVTLWTGSADALIPVHMILGILTVLSLWVLAVSTATAKGGNWGLAGGAIVLGLIVMALGLRQQLILVGAAHWVIQVIHLLLGVSAVGMGEVLGGRYRRFNKASAAAQTAQ